MLILKVKLERWKKLKTRVNLVFSTKEEINPIQLAQLPGTDGYLAFNADEFKREVEKAMSDTSIGVTESGKTFSQIFRGVCFQIALNNGWDADEYYRQEMSKIINHYKQKYL